LRQQALREQIDHLEAILFTHTHVDHVFGLDEVRRFNVLGNKIIPVYASADSIVDIRRIFSYIFNSPRVIGGIPSIQMHEITGPFDVCGLRVQPIPIRHGNLTILGFRLRDVAFLTDCSGIPEESMGRLRDLDLLILDALRQRPHPTHLSLSQACSTARKIGARQTLFVHCSHNLEHEATNRGLPPEMQLAYDGQQVAFD